MRNKQVLIGAYIERSVFDKFQEIAINQNLSNSEMLTKVISEHLGISFTPTGRKSSRSQKEIKGRKEQVLIGAYVPLSLHEEFKTCAKQNFRNVSQQLKLLIGSTIRTNQ